MFYNRFLFSFIIFRIIKCCLFFKILIFFQISLIKSDLIKMQMISVSENQNQYYVEMHLNKSEKQTSN